jgi:hypothetical protein
MKPHYFVWVVKKWYGVRTDHTLRCFDNPKGLNCGDLLASRRGSRVPELANCLRLGTAVWSQDLSGAWIIIQG